LSDAEAQDAWDRLKAGETPETVYPAKLLTNATFQTHNTSSHITMSGWSALLAEVGAGDTSTSGTTHPVDRSSSATPIAFSGTVPTLNGTVGTSFSQDIGAYFDGTETPFAFTLQAGTLPAGLSLNSSTGVISGTPTTAGTSSGLVVRGTDATPDTDDTNSFSIVIAAAAATSLAVSVPDAAGVTGVNGVVLSAAAPGSGVTVIKTITAASFDGSGNMAIDITGLGVTVGQYRYVVLSKSDGTTGQSPAPFAAQGPVIAS
jgi:Putative Ig domain